MKSNQPTEDGDFDTNWIIVGRFVNHCDLPANRKGRRNHPLSTHVHEEPRECYLASGLYSFPCAIYLAFLISFLSSVPYSCIVVFICLSLLLRFDFGSALSYLLQ